ncbi:EP300-interacting inhibitor of differentiation 3-like [Uloborus diversus]|uniref:EP300-interacting inhibitor of differentiation 3-like n=1 Tax=Uloborus diversus TaxID=327109 RepID=UPI00240926F6|nr:EP300-interacting inhibitor of differentiation 3-like [Uloborus diversus]
MDVTAELKKLNLEIQANKDKYVNGELDLGSSLEKQENLFSQIMSNQSSVTASKILPDSQVLQLQTKILTLSTRKYKPDSLVFNSYEFAGKVRDYFGCDLSSSIASTSRSSSLIASTDYSSLWMNLGDEAKTLICGVPTFSFIYGTFDPDPVEHVKKKRKVRDKDKVGDLTKPQSMSINDSTHEHDGMLTEAERLYSILRRFLERSENGLVCYFEFVTDPSSFSRTVENIFIMSLLIKEGHVRIIADENGLPYLKAVNEDERRERNPAAMKQTIVTITLEDWKEIIRKFRFEKALIPPRKRA